MKLALAQQNFLVGDVEGNAEKIIQLATQARDQGAELLVCPELALTGYPPEDLLLRPSLNTRVQDALADIAEQSGLPVLLGYPGVRNGKRYNIAGLLLPGQSEPASEYFKQCLPNYRVFDEKRYFTAGSGSGVFELAGMRLGITVCEDIWHPEPATACLEGGAQVIINLNASPFRAGKHQERLAQVEQRVAETGLPVIYLNTVGGQDELVFDGGSFALDAQGELQMQASFFDEQLVMLEVDQQCLRADIRQAQPDEEAAMYQALVVGVRDYVNKNGFRGALLGLSGGIDSALTLAVAVDALGSDRVEAIMMPFRYTSSISLEDAEKQADTLSVTYRVLPIESAYDSFMDILAEPFAGRQADTTEENLQARCRGVILMALSNKSGAVVLTTGNKSEVAVGYSTLYGDMAGGFDVLKDVPKTWVYRLSRYRNRVAGEEIIPDRVITRPPSAELAPDQCDQDSLPDYDELDRILELYVEQDLSAEAVIRAGFDRDTVYRVVRLVDRNEYKRRQAPIGPRVTRRAFGKDRRYPITNGWRPGD